jgi:hypothetical protein
VFAEKGLLKTIGHPELVEGSVQSAFFQSYRTDLSTSLRSAQDDGIFNESFFQQAPSVL